MRAAKIRPLSPAAVGAYMAEPRRASCARQTAGIGLDVLQVGGSIVIRIPADLHLRCRQRGGEAAVRRDPARNRADGEDPQPDLRRRARPHRHVGHAAGQPGAVGEARRRGRDLSRRPRRRPRRGSRRGLWRKRAALQSRRRRRPRRRPTAGSKSGSSRTAASAARRRSAAAARRPRPRRSRRARRADDGRSAGRRCARRGPRRRPWDPRRRSAAPSIRASAIAAAHIAHGSSVTHKVQSSSREVPSCVAAARIATISAWAVGSIDPRIALRASATISSPRVTTAPTGTSPAAAASAARSSARRIGGGSGKAHRPAASAAAARRCQLHARCWSTGAAWLLPGCWTSSAGHLDRRVAWCRP